MQKELKIVLGPTAVGKTDYSIKLAKEYHSPIISCDSRQIYKELKIGSAPPSPEQLAEVKHYFIASHTITDHYTAGRYELDALEVLDTLFKEHDTLIMCGGSALYIDALCYGLDAFPDADLALREKLNNRLELEGLESLRFELKKCDPETYQVIDLANARRVVRALEVFYQTGTKFSDFKTNSVKERPFKITKILIERPREELYDRINRRVDIMIDNGLVSEAKDLLPFRNLPSLNTVGYRELFEHFEGKHSMEKAIELIKRNTRHFAKKQISWWRELQTQAK